MQTKVNGSLVKEITDKILQAIDGIDSKVSATIKRSFYFKGRKSENIAAKIIEALTAPEDVILDPFFGGGSFVISALEASRFIYGIELDNYTYDVVKHLFLKIDDNKLMKYFEQIQTHIKDSIMNLYRTNCCGHQNYIQKLYFDPIDEEYYHPQTHRENVDGKNIKLVEMCPVCKKSEKVFDDYDHQVIQESNSLDNEKFPNDKYIENSRINITSSTGADRYNKLFSTRNQHALLLLQSTIDSLPDSYEKRIIQHSLVTSLALAKISMYGSSTDILYHVVNQKAQDMNVWHLFEYNFKCMIRFKETYSSFQVQDVEENKFFQLLKGSYRTVLDEQPQLKVDLIYTDFPYTDQVPYLERSQLFRKWLEHFASNQEFRLTQEMLNEEIVITNAPSRPNKNNSSNYFSDIDIMFSTLQRHLKAGKFAIFTVKLGQKKYIQTLSTIINLARKNGFEYITKIGIEKTDPTLRKQSAYANTFMNEMIVVFKKLKDQDAYWYIGDTNYEFEATKQIYQYLLANRNKPPVTKTFLAEIVQKNLFAKGHVLSNIEYSKLNELIQKYFYVNSGYVDIDSNRLYLGIEDTRTLFVKLYDLIPVFIKRLLSEKGHFLLEDLYFELSSSLCDGSSSTISQILDDQKYEHSIKNILDNYCVISNGYYIKKPIINIGLSHSDDISQYSGTDFEKLMRELLEKEGYLNIILTGGAGDRGVDIICEKLENNVMSKIIFQCKRWITNVGSEPMQRLFAERKLHNFNKAVCVTTSNFTKEGKRAAGDFDIELWDGFKVINLLDKHFPGQYYNRALDIKEDH